MNIEKMQTFIHNTWEQSIIPALCEYVSIPCKSVAFDAEWEKNGYIDQAIQLISAWCHAQQIFDMRFSIHKLPGHTPILLMDIPGQCSETVLLYGHLDKQPEMDGWLEGLAPWKPVIKDGKLYGRGSADDGYAVFSALTAIKALQEQKIPHARCIILIETSEESGSVDLPVYMQHLKKEIGKPDLIICLDSGADNYNQLWCTTSLRGMVNAALTVEILTEGVHSGAASGVVPSSFRILRQLLDRLENVATGEVLLKEFYVDIPNNRILEAEKIADTIGDEVWKNYPWIKGSHPSRISNKSLILNRTWMPTLSIIGAGDIPTIKNAGNVIRPRTSLVLSLRTPPTCNSEMASKALKKALEYDPPYGANISVDILNSAHGWNAPELQNWLHHAIDEASLIHFGKNAMYKGEGGSIPFMHMLGQEFPQAQFVITGVLGPHSNAHGPNEFLHIDTAKKVTSCVASILAAHAMQIRDHRS